MSRVDVLIDGSAYSLNEGMNLFDELERAGLDVKGVCHHSLLDGREHCRLCLIKDTQSNQLIKSCATSIRQDMSLSFDNREVKDAFEVHRSLILSQHELACSRCAQRGSCTLESDLNISDREWSDDYFNYRLAKSDDVEKLSEELSVNLGKCIDCDKCVVFERSFAKDPSLIRKDGIECVGLLDHNMGINLVSLCPTGCFEHKDFSQIENTHIRHDVCRGCDRLCGVDIKRQELKNVTIGPKADHWICDEASLMLRDQALTSVNLEPVKMDGEGPALFIVPYGLDDDHYNWVIRQLAADDNSIWYLFGWPEREKENGFLRKNRNLQSKPLSELVEKAHSQKLNDLRHCGEVSIHLFAPPYILDMDYWSNFVNEAFELRNPLKLYHMDEKWRPEFYHDKICGIISNQVFTGINYLGESFDS
jgi:hypothetical protein